MPLDALVTGRIATLAGPRGFGWVEAVGIKDGRVAFAGSAIELETRADPFTVRFELDPDEVAIPGLTDAHLHLADGAIATENVDLSGVPSLEDGLALIGEAHQSLPVLVLAEDAPLPAARTAARSGAISRQFSLMPTTRTRPSGRCS